MILPLAQVHLLGKRPGPLYFRGGKVGCGGAISATIGRLLCKCGLRFFPLHEAPVVRRVVSPQQQHWRCSRGVEQPPKRWKTPHATHRGAYPQFRCVCPKRWQRLHCNAPFGATYDSTDNRNPQSSVRDRTFNTSGPRATDTLKWGWEGDLLWGPGSDGWNAAV